MGVVYGLLLIVLGLIATREIIESKVPAAKKVLDTLHTYEESIGFAGLVLGIIWALRSLFALSYLFSRFVPVLEAWVVSFLALALGLIYGLGLLKKIVGYPGPGFLVTLDHWHARLLPYRKELGFAAIAMGIIYIL